MSQAEGDDGAVGYRKPPKHTQFKPGQSGNPKGRPKGRQGLSAILETELQRFVKVTEDGRTKRMTKAEAVAKRLVNGAMKGDSKATALLARFTSPGDEHESSAQQASLSEREKQHLSDLLGPRSRRK